MYDLGHLMEPVEGSVYSLRGPNALLPANLMNRHHYPVEAVCGCGGMIRSEEFADRWRHTGRMAGEPEEDAVRAALAAAPEDSEEREAAMAAREERTLRRRADPGWHAATDVCEGM